MESDQEPDFYLEDKDIAQVIEENDYDECMKMSDDEYDDPENEQEQIQIFDDSIQGFFDHHAPVYSLAIHPKDPFIAASGGGDDSSYLWHVNTGEKICDLAKHSDSVISVSFSHDGEYVSSGGMDGKCFVFNTQTGALVVALEGPSEITWTHWHNRGLVLLAGSEDGTVWMWQIPSGTCMNVFAGHVDSVTCGEFTPDGKMVVTGSTDGSVVVWDPKNGSAIHRFSGEDTRFHQTAITSLAVSLDSSLILSGAQDGTARILHALNGKVIGSIDNHTESIESCKFSSFGDFMATASVDNNVTIWEVSGSRLRHVLKHDNAVTGLSWHPSLPHLVTISMDNNVRLWDSRNGALLKVFRGHQEPIISLAVSEKYFITGSDDGTALVFSLE